VLIRIAGEVPPVELVNLQDEAIATNAQTQEIAFSENSAPIPLSKDPLRA